MEDTLLVSMDKHVMTIAWNRPDKKNAITQEMYGKAADALVSASKDQAVRAVLITGTKDIFTAGNDLSDFQAGEKDGNVPPVERFLDTISSFMKPLVAAVNGPAVGVGTTMLLHCDMVVAADTTVFALPFAKLGVCPEASSSYLLPLVAGYHRAAELLLLGDNFDANFAKDCGFVNHICSPDTYQAQAMTLAHKLAAMPASSIRHTKKFLKQTHQNAMRQRMAEEGTAFGELLKSPEFTEATSAFIQKRTPNFAQFD